MIAHVGLPDFGHYCAYIRSSADAQWFCFNDSSVCAVSHAAPDRRWPRRALCGVL